MPRARPRPSEETSLSVAYFGPPVSRPLGLPLPPFVCLFEDRDTFGPVVAVVVDLDVLPGLVARVAAELVEIGPHIARVVVVASE